MRIHLSCRSLLVALVAGLLVVAFSHAASAADPVRVTLTGMSKALGDPNGNLNPSAANATLTVTEDGNEVVYYVHGWAGVICAKQADGKKVDVTGVIGEKDGKKIITGKSIDVKIIIVE